MSAVQLQSLAVVLFRHAGQCFAFEAQQVIRQGRGDDSQGLALIHYAELFTHDLQAASTAVQWLELRGSQTLRWRLGLQTPAELVELPAAGIYALPAALQTRREFAALKALAIHNNELIALLDVNALQQIADTRVQESHSSH